MHDGQLTWADGDCEQYWPGGTPRLPLIRAPLLYNSSMADRQSTERPFVGNIVTADNQYFKTNVLHP